MAENPMRWHIGALAFYALLSFIFIGHGVSVKENILGGGSDPYSFIWFLAWWPFAIVHHLNPLHAAVMWPPMGVPTLWVTSVPLLAVLGLPTTLLAGPVLTYNLLILTAPVLSAWCAYRLCFHITRRPIAAVIGGYIFGFSSYEIAADYATPNLSFTMLLPCLTLLVLQRYENAISRRRSIFFATLILVLQFLISSEIFATLILFTCTALVLAFLASPPYRQGVRVLAGDAMVVAPLTVLILLPLLISMLKYAHYAARPAAWPYLYAADLGNLIIPTRLTAIGGATFATISGLFKGNIQEQGAYLGLPLCLILALFLRQEWRTPSGRTTRLILFVMLIASFGPLLWVCGTNTGIVLPWQLLLHVPLISSALPCRLAMYVSLICAVVASCWMATAPKGRRRHWRLAFGVLACLCLAPAPHLSQKIPVAAFFQPGRLEAVLGANVRILALPFGESAYWQAENNFGYTATMGFLGFPPSEMQHFAAVGDLFGWNDGTNEADDLRVFCFATNTQYIVAGPGTTGSVFAALAKLHWQTRQSDDVTIFTVPAHG